MEMPLERVKAWLQRSASDLVGSRGTIVGLDIGSYGLRAVLADLRTATLHTTDSPLPFGDAEPTTAAAIELVQGLIAASGTQPRHLARIGIGFGGPVDGPRGTTRVSYRKAGWEQFPLAARFEEALDASTLVDNDANVTALAEAVCGVGHEARHLFYLHLSSGVGGGMVVGDRLYHGWATMAGEIGHAMVDRNGPPCSCGGKGHLESYVSVRALLRRLGELGVQTDDLKAVFVDSPPARQTVEEAAELLGLVLANVVTLIDPQLIVVGGVVARTGGTAFLDRIRDYIQQYQAPTLARPVPVLPSSFGLDSVAVGGLTLAAESLQE